MATQHTGRNLLEVPHSAVYVLLAANVIAYAVCLRQNGGEQNIAVQILSRDGAISSWALQRHEYWRLFAHGFLHFNLVHLTANMLCLALWGGHLEQRIGTTYFLVTYFSSLILGAVVGHLLHPVLYLTAGASGATSGILGALLCLWILDKVPLSANFFLVNIGLNVALAVSYSGIDWRVHLGGFTVGLITCAVLDVIERLNSMLLRCKFPEFVKANLLALACGAGAIVWNSEASASTHDPTMYLLSSIFVLACLATLKLIDIVLSVQKGVAIVAVLLSSANAVLVLFGANVLARQSSFLCSPHGPDNPGEVLLNVACVNAGTIVILTGAAVFAITMLLYSREISRGISDVGFVAASLRAERKRRQGI